MYHYSEQADTRDLRERGKRPRSCKFFVVQILPVLALLQTVAFLQLASLLKGRARLFKASQLNEIVSQAFVKSFSAHKTRPKVIKEFSCSTQLSMKFKMLISIKISGNSTFFRLR